MAKSQRDKTHQLNGALQAYLDEYRFRFSRHDFGPRLLERLVLAVGASAQPS